MNTKEYNHAVRQHADDLYRFALRYLGRGADDAVQDTFVALWERRAEVDARRAKGWLMRVLYRKLVDEHRRREAERRASEASARAATANGDRRHAETFELRDAFSAALPHLPEQQRMLLLLRDLEGYDYREMADMTGLSEEQVGVYLYRARRTMKKLMEDYL